jgi:hypothetical protein
MIPSTVLMTLLNGELSGYFQALGYNCTDAEDDDALKARADMLLKLTVGDWCNRSGADLKSRMREIDQEMTIYEL